MVFLWFLVLALTLAAVTLAYPALPTELKRTTLAEVNGGENDPLEDVSRVLDRFARQIAGNRSPPKHWSPLHRDVLRGALQVTKQLLGYEGWTPDHLELLKGEREILYEHVADDADAGGAGTLERSGDAGIPNTQDGINKEDVTKNVGVTNNEEVTNNGEGADNGEGTNKEASAPEYAGGES